MDRIKEIVGRLKALWEQMLERSALLRHVLAMMEWYNQRRGNAYAAAISFIGFLSLVPILMVSFAIAAFVLVWNPNLLTEITDAVVENIPGSLGEQLNSVIDSAIQSRRTVGVIGLVSAALAGIGWMGLMRNGLTEMWGGRVKNNAILAKVYDLGIFVAMGLVFAATIALSVLTSSAIGPRVMELLAIPENGMTLAFLQVATIVISLVATWGLFIVVLSVLPRCTIPIRAVVWAALGTAVIFQVLKSVGGIYLKSVMGSPAGAAFGPIIGLLVFAYLASRIVLYAAAWSASAPKNEAYLIVDELEEQTEPEPKTVLLAPVYEAEPDKQARRLIAAAGVGAAAAGLAGWLGRGDR
ncbi:YhjD/YihY/BrkB family envelope integrity protein [Gordonia hydrophobica]|uniref:YhjD/YihY/BrkB family envelope integrity protein n=1 Tax=Gordonia hydrophobica TaxID=40516 RepID=A0ABZ2U1V0_9ACTN|nr:YhjD/YihY/BrkB family envelope integrity protein [Gordonia hydrophobica]MBM7366716.1 membrane protein [Gordonia hydrophobica]